MTTGDLPGPRPQPLGALPWPAGMLVLPATAGADEVAAALVRGEQPEGWPEQLAFVATALRGDAVGAAAQVAGDDAVAAYNRAVLVGGDAAWDALLATGGELRALVGTARYSLGLDDAAPAVDGCVGEVAAVVRSARASAALEAADVAAAVEELGRAADDAQGAGSPLLAAQLHATAAELLRERLDRPADAARTADRALQSLPRTAPAELRAELLVTRALSRQVLAGTERGPLMAVVMDLQEALKTFTEADHPEAFAACNQHLALAYLVMPMSDDGDRVRLGIAVTSLRAALRVFTPGTHPIAWASTQLNLANALQYLPSVHQEQNLDEAVQLYEELLAYRDPTTDPVGTARILANQANALGHLGVFTDAHERALRARDLFAANGIDEGVAGVDEILASIDSARAAAAGGR